MKILSIVVFVFFLTSCQSFQIATDSRYREPASPSTIEISQSLNVFPDTARAFLQNGAVISQEQLNLYQVNCEVEIATVAEVQRSISPGIFTITAMVQDESPIVMRKPIMVAALYYASSTPPDIKRYYRFHLASQQTEGQSSVRALICRGSQAAHNEAELPTLEQMQAAVGDYIKIIL